MTGQQFSSMIVQQQTRHLSFSIPQLAVAIFYHDLVEYYSAIKKKEMMLIAGK
jgi:hypothetical protein